jgi:hypothetical protein
MELKPIDGELQPHERLMNAMNSNDESQVARSSLAGASS